MLASKMVNHPLDPVHVLLARRRRRRAGPGARTRASRQLARQPVYLRSVAFRTRRFGSFEVFSPSIPIESAPSADGRGGGRGVRAGRRRARDVDVAQVQDTESGAEVMHMAETGLCEHGEQEVLVQSGATTLDGRLPINTDGGCLANGEPIGASGLRQVHEVVLQLRGDAGDRQIPGRAPRRLHAGLWGARRQRLRRAHGLRRRAMQAYQLVEWQQAPELRDVDVPEPGPGEVLIKVGGAGACHSDLHVMEWPAGTLPYELPFTLGHENAGWIEAVGPGVTGWDVGAGVAVYGPWGCGRCRACRTTLETLCERGARDRRRGRRPRPRRRDGRVHARARHPVARAARATSTRATPRRSPTPP